MTATDILVMSSAESENGETAPGGQPQGPFEVSLQYSGPAVLLWLWSNAHSSEDTGLKAQSIQHTAGNTGQSSSHCFANVTSLLNYVVCASWTWLVCKQAQQSRCQPGASTTKAQSFRNTADDIRQTDRQTNGRTDRQTDRHMGMSDCRLAHTHELLVQTQSWYTRTAGSTGRVVYGHELTDTLLCKKHAQLAGKLSAANVLLIHQLRRSSQCLQS